jgi:membrane protease YdiL (CAAX protease family)
LAIGACITAPILEELLFRGLILSSFSKRFGPIIAIIISSLVFSLLHIVPSVIAGLFLNSLIVGWVVFKTRSIICGILVHSLNNTIAMIEILIIGNDNLEMISKLNSLEDFIYCSAYLLLGAIGVIMGIVWLNRKINPSEISIRPG